MSWDRLAALLVLYGLAFACLHWAARPWSGAAFFSLWYPAAGLRFAVLWRCGPRLTPWLMVTELIADIATGTLPLNDPTLWGDVLGVCRPALGFCIAIAAAQWITRRASGPLTLPPMPFGMAALAGPTLNALLFLPMEVLLPQSGLPQAITADIVISLTGLAVGDLLGVLVLAPALLWLADAITQSPMPRLALPAPRRVLYDLMALAACLLLTDMLWRAGLGMQPMPMLLAGAWIGLRHGRTSAWFAVLIEMTLFLPYSAGDLADDDRLELHLGIAAIVLVTWLAGSFADAQAAARTQLERRNRLLFQAERLKTLRAMSVAVIHEISQPLSTLAIEAAHLRDVTADFAPDIVQSIELVDRKARILAELVRTLRRFGGRDADETTALSIGALLETARQIVAAELRNQGCRLELIAPSPDLTIEAHEIELTQALVNLLRNAIAATFDKSVELRAQHCGNCVEIEVTNMLDPAKRGHEMGNNTGSGMGIGLIIVRTIVEAHGGMLICDKVPDRARFVISLPLAGPLP
jgi:two-component system, LuxR family, sensor kinase FixL